MGELDAQPREWAWQFFRLNPIVTFFGLAVLWGLTIWCMVTPDEALTELNGWKTGITDYFSWFYVGSRDAWCIFAVVLYFSKYGKLKLCAKGEENKPPEFTNIEYFMMLFGAGVAVGLFFFGVAEPVRHYVGPNRYTAGEYRTDNEQAQWAMTLTVFHWGLHGWVPYTIIASCLGFVHFRMGLPMCVRSAFYPLVGNKIFGWFGDFVDIYSVIVAVTGVSTSLGLGVQQIAAGMLRIDPDFWDFEDKATQTNVLVVIIWCITAVSTISVVSGVNMGIKHLSTLAFVLGWVLWGYVFFVDDTWFFLNNMVQTLGHYFQNIVGLGFITDSFAQLQPEEGAAPDGEAAPNFIDEWTIFYWGLRITWAPFVGVFIARISKGRTIREVVNYSLFAPLLYAVVWFSVFGGAAIIMQNRAAALVEEGALETYTGSGCYETSNPAHSPVCDLGGAGTSGSMLFMLMEQYYGLGKSLSVLSVMAIALYFITTSDSGSLVVEYISSNGHQKPHPVQRIMWAFTEGACASGLITAGGLAGTSALQAASISAGLPYTVLLCLMCASLWQMCREVAGDTPLPLQRKSFKLSMLGGVFDTFEWMLSAGKHPLPSANLVGHFFKAVFFPGYFLFKVNMALPSSRRQTIVATVAANLAFYGFVLLHLAQHLESGLWGLAWTLFLSFCLLMTRARSSVRDTYGILGNVVEDFFTVLIAYPQVCVQMVEQVQEPVPKRDFEEAPLKSGDVYTEEAKSPAGF
ncbi:unnamed protein product [Discosporangium mesarthrocarpum]